MTDELHTVKVSVAHYEEQLDLLFEPRHDFLSDPERKDEDENNILADCQ